MSRSTGFEPLSDEQYDEMGFRCGLEVHRQLDTSRKLFCHCPPGRYSERTDAEVLRHMRPTLSEMGGYDGTALMEFKTRKDIVYLLDSRTVCTYEMDDTPPFPPDPEAIDIALSQAMLCGCSLVGEIHIIRKQYLDGSIPTGFQRTFLVGVDGQIPVGDRLVKVIQISLEEDSCRELSDVGHLRHYRTDRLGMPITEIVTEPAFLTPAQALEGALAIQQLERTTQVRRGIGTARQDVNVSVRGGTRVEIKGVPRIPLIPRLTHFEALRQSGLLALRERLAERAPAEPARDGDRVRLPGFADLIDFSLGGSRTFRDELCDRVRVIACLDPARGLRFTTDGDAAVVTASGPAQDVATALSEIAIRAAEAREGVPSETRQVRPDGTTGFERILPGADRMYPDTDMPPIPVTAERIARLEAALPEPVWERVARAREAGLPSGLAGLVAVSPRWPLFRESLDRGQPATRSAVLLVETARALERRGHDPDGVDWPALLAADVKPRRELATALAMIEGEA